MNGKILLFIPVYNCEVQIVRVLSALDDTICQHIDEILVIDNNSQDMTSLRASDELKKLSLVKSTLLQNKTNVNLGGSHKVAFNYSIQNNYDVCIVMHGDDQADVQDLKKILIQDFGNWDCLLGARFAPQSQLIGYSLFRKCGNLTLNFLLSVLFTKKIHDMGSGLNAYKINYLRRAPFMFYANNLTFNIYMLLHAVVGSYKIKFFPLIWKEVDQVSNAKVFKQAFSIIKLSLLTRFDKKIVLNPQANEYSNLKYDYRVLYTSNLEAR